MIKTKWEAMTGELDRMRADIYKQLGKNNICLNDDYTGEENEAKHLALGYLQAISEMQEYIEYMERNAPIYAHLK